MIEKTILDYLNDNLEVPVYMETPESIPDKYCIIEKTGSLSSDRHISESTIIVQSYGTSLYDAAELSQTVIGEMYGITSSTEVTRCELDNEYNSTDPNTKRYRYTAVFLFVHY